MANIGKLALTVTTNAAPALKDLDSFEKKVGATGKSVEKVASKTEAAGGGGGLFGFITGGAVGGAVAAGFGAAAKGLEKMLGLLGSVQAEAGKLGYQFSALDSRKIQQANLAIGNVKGVLLETFGRGLAAMEPAITKVASLLVDMIARAQPAITWAADKLGGVMVYALNLLSGTAGVAAAELNTLWKAFERGGGFTDKWLEMATVVKSVLKVILIGFGYVFDTIKVGWGLVLAPFGKLLEETGKMGVRAGVGWAKDVEMIGAGMKNVGKDMIFSFGRSHDRINKMFNELDKRARNTGNNLRQAFIAYAPAGALLAGSQAEYSVKARFSMENQLNPQVEVAKQQLEQQKAANDVLKDIRDALRDFRPVELGVF